MSSRLIIAAALVCAVGCSKPAQRQQQVQKHQAPLPTPIQISEMSPKNLVVMPEPIRRNERSTVRIEFAAPRPGAPLRLSWFGADGWLVHDTVGTVEKTSTTFAIPAGAFPAAGQYHYQLSSDTVNLLQGEVEVTG